MSVCPSSPASTGQQPMFWQPCAASRNSSGGSSRETKLPPVTCKNAVDGDHGAEQALRRVRALRRTRHGCGLSTVTLYKTVLDARRAEFQLSLDPVQTETAAGTIAPRARAARRPVSTRRARCLPAGPHARIICRKRILTSIVVTAPPRTRHSVCIPRRPIPDSFAVLPRIQHSEIEALLILDR